MAAAGELPFGEVVERNRAHFARKRKEKPKRQGGTRTRCRGEGVVRPDSMLEERLQKEEER